MAEKLASFIEAWFARMTSPLTVATWATISLLIAFGGPFNTFASMAFPVRLALWSGLIGVAIMVAMAICEIVKDVTGDARTIARDLKVSVLFAGLYGPATWAYFLTFGEPGNDLAFSLWRTTLYVFLIIALVMFLRRVLGVGDEPIADGPGPIHRFGGVRAAEIARLSVDDHYVEIHTHCGSKRRVLMRFSDAMSQVAEIEGLRVHRSHWVARNAIDRIAREKGRLFVVTRDQARVPISRGFRGDVEAAGLI